MTILSVSLSLGHCYLSAIYYLGLRPVLSIDALNRRIGATDVRWDVGVEATAQPHSHAAFGQHAHGRPGLPRVACLSHPHGRATRLWVASVGACHWPRRRPAAIGVEILSRSKLDKNACCRYLLYALYIIIIMVS